MTDLKSKALELYRSYFLGAYSPNDDAGCVAAIAAALAEVENETQLAVIGRVVDMLTNLALSQHFNQTERDLLFKIAAIMTKTKHEAADSWLRSKAAAVRGK